MAELDLLRNIGVMIVGAASAVIVLQLLKIPTIVSYILVGLFVGPFTGLIGPSGTGTASDSLQLIAEIGIALLLFLVGLELSLQKIRDVGRVAVWAGLGQVAFTAAGGFLLSTLLGFNVMESIFLSTALTFSSTVIVVKLLDQKRELDSLYGRIAVGIFLVQDLVAIVILTFVAGLGSPEVFDAVAMFRSLARAFLGMGGLLAVSMLAARYLLPRPFGWAVRSMQTLFLWSVFWCFALVVGAEELGLSPEIGAFLAGVSLAQLDCSQELRRRLHPLMNFFIAIFFISLGAQMQLDAAMEHAWAGAVLSLFVIVGNPLIFIWIIARNGFSERVSFLTGVTVAQISEFSFIFAALGVSSGLIDLSILSVIALIGLVTIGVSTYMILYNHQLYAWFRGGRLLGLFGAGHHDDAPAAPASLGGHIIVVGMNALGRELVDRLCRRGETVLAIDTDPRKLAGLPCRTLTGSIDNHAVLDDASLENARLVVSALQIEDATLLLTYRCRQLGVPIAVHAFDRSVIESMLRERPDFLINSRERGVDYITEELVKAGVLAG